MKPSISKISIFTIVLFGVIGIFPNENKELLFILLGISSVLSLLAVKQLKFHKLIIINSILFLSYALALTYTSDIGVAAKRFETGASLIIAPMVFSLFYYNQKSVFTEKVQLLLYKTVHWSNVLLMIIMSVFYLKLKFIDGKDSYGYFLSHLERKLPLIGDHPIYISLILGISVIMTLSYLLSKKTTIKFNLTYGVTAVFLVLTIVFLSRRGVILALLISLLFIVLLHYKRDKVKVVSTVFGVLMLFLGLLYIIPQTNKRISEVLKTATYSSENETNSTNNRIQIYKCAINLIKERPMLGYGIEDDRKALNQCYKENLYYLFEHKYNTHNQYLSILMKTGIVGLFLFLGFMYYNMKLGMKSQDWLFTGILVFFMIVMMFENILERQNGVMLFAFFINYLAFKNQLVLTRSKS